MDMAQGGPPRPAPGVGLPGATPQQPGPSEIMLSPASFELPAGRDLAMALNVRSGDALANLSLTISFDPRVLELKNIQSSVRPSTTGAAPFLSRIDNASGSAVIGFTSPDAAKGTQGGFTLAALQFTAKAAGEAIVAVANATATSIAGRPIMFQTGQSRIVVR